MIQQPQFLSQPRQFSPILNRNTSNKKPNVYFTYQDSPKVQNQQNPNVVRQQSEEKRRKKIFQPRRKLSFEEMTSRKLKSNKLRIFQHKSKRNFIMNSPFRLNKINSNYLSQKDGFDIFSSLIENQKFLELEKNNRQLQLDQNLNISPFKQRSHICLKESVISGAETIVDQLEHLPPQIQQINPINRKLLNMKNRQTKRTYYSNTVKNSLIFPQKTSALNNHRNRIDSQVLTYQYSPNNKYRSSVTIKAASRPYEVSKFSNGLSILTNDNNNHKDLFYDFKGKEDVQTPKYHKSAQRSILRQSYQPSIKKVKESENQSSKKQIYKKYNSLQVNNLHAQTDRFYDESSIETPRLPVVSKKVSYEVIDPLSSSLKKQKLQRNKLLKQIPESIEIKDNNNFTKLKTFLHTIIVYLSQVSLKAKNSALKGKQKCVGFLKSELFFLMMVVLLGLVIFIIQLVQ